MSQQMTTGDAATTRAVLRAAVTAVVSPPLSALAAIALTAFATDADRQKAMDAGYDGHVAKPATHEALVAAVKRVVAPPANRGAPPPA